MKGIVWYYTKKEVGLAKLENIIEEYRRMRINIIHRTMDYVEFDNQDIWQICSVQDRSRGHACNISLIERGTPEDLINIIIKPCTKAFPYRAFNYYT